MCRSRRQSIPWDERLRHTENQQNRRMYERVGRGGRDKEGGKGDIMVYK